MIQFLNQSRKEGKSVWRTFWRGGNVAGVTEDPREDRKQAWNIPSMVWGVTHSWNLILAIVIGIWLMFSPDVLGGSKTLADSNHLTGALIVTFSFIALSEVGRITRFLNLFVGLWLVIGTWFLGPTELFTIWNAVIMGIVLIPLSFPLGKIRDSYGTYDPWVYWPPKKRHKRSFTFKLRHEH